MPLDLRVARFLQLLAASQPAALTGMTVEGRRASLASLLAFAGPPPAVTAVAVGSLPGPAGPLRIHVYTPLGAARGLLPGLVYFHGGGLCAGSVTTHDGIARELANAGRCRVVSVDYRLAPEHPFPAAVDDALAATRHVAAHAADFGIDPKRLGVGGDSAGATLAAAVCHLMASEGQAPLALQLLLCPILDHSRTSASRREFAAGYLVDEPTLAHDLAQYLPSGGDLTDPRISPLCARTVEGLPPTLVHTAEFDPLRDEGAAYHSRLAAAGTGAGYTCHPGMIHLFYGLKAVIPYAATAFEQIGRELRIGYDSAESV
jgi:acetyl esterase/lipase